MKHMVFFVAGKNPITDSHGTKGIFTYMNG